MSASHRSSARIKAERFAFDSRGLADTPPLFRPFFFACLRVPLAGRSIFSILQKKRRGPARTRGGGARSLRLPPTAVTPLSLQSNPHLSCISRRNGPRE